MPVDTEFSVPTAQNSWCLRASFAPVFHGAVAVQPGTGFVHPGREAADLVLVAVGRRLPWHPRRTGQPEVRVLGRSGDG